jgi:hypothetical protein
MERRHLPLGGILPGRYYSAAQSVNGCVFVVTGNRPPPAHFPSEELAGDDCKLARLALDRHIGIAVLIFPENVR